MGDHAGISDAMQVLQKCPYGIEARLDLANAFHEQGYPDLALGEAYLALMLLDEIWDDCGEWHGQAISAMRQETAGDEDFAASLATEGQEQAEEACEDEAGETGDNSEDEDEELPISSSEALWLAGMKKKVYISLVANCLIIGCIKQAFEFLERGLNVLSGLEDSDTTDNDIQKMREQVTRIDVSKLHYLDDYRTILEQGYNDLPERAMVRRELYPWNDSEPDRYSSQSLQILQGIMSQIAPKLEVKVTELADLSSPEAEKSGAVVRQLGVFAKEDLQPGELILDELSLLTATSRLNDAFCDACSKALPGLSSRKTTPHRNGDNANPAEEKPITCPECAETVFCSQRCLDLATDSYHPALCDSSVSNIAKDADAKHAADDLYTLLVLRALAMSETQGVHPLDLPEVAWIWGDFTTAPAGITGPKAWQTAAKTLPFTFRNNIELPLQFLFALEGADPFLSTTSDPPVRLPPATHRPSDGSKDQHNDENENEEDNAVQTTSSHHTLSTINTLFSKLRGTASARQGPDYKPEVAAVHPMWCLANHSCDPNVKWEWEGGMKFWVRKQEEKVVWSRGDGNTTGKDGDVSDEGLLVSDLGKLGVGDGGRSTAGIRKGEEVFGHYCDVGLDVKERREWAAGALGGLCRCERCMWEAGEPGPRR